MALLNLSLSSLYHYHNKLNSALNLTKYVVPKNIKSTMKRNIFLARLENNTGLKECFNGQLIPRCSLQHIKLSSIAVTGEIIKCTVGKKFV